MMMYRTDTQIKLAANVSIKPSPNQTQKTINAHVKKIVKMESFGLEGLHYSGWSY